MCGVAAVAHDGEFVVNVGESLELIAEAASEL